jgi:hypothetical protein
MTIKKNGGLWFWRIGRVGGSFYVAKARRVERPRSEWSIALRASRYEIAATAATIAALVGFAT